MLHLAEVLRNKYAWLQVTQRRLVALLTRVMIVLILVVTWYKSKNNKLTLMLTYLSQENKETA